MSDLLLPAATLAAKIGNAITEAGLMRAERKSKLVARISSGQMSAADWKTEIDLAVEKAEEA
ncbi:hypothetical protein [Altererythrobacter sp. ZODW24]|uniref:hypothetical protein n=1 Tax=Altererythrobacter sp. ZODW24 TaxID=2185142 RepID=UPI000DF844BE|nr:hypothetical protein [Altererythrobacter sp. ZODW24]